MPLKKAMFKSRQGIKRKSIDSEDGILKLWQIKTVHRLYHWKTPLTIKPWVFENIVILSDEQRSYKNLNGKLQFFKKKSIALRSIYCSHDCLKYCYKSWSSKSFMSIKVVLWIKHISVRQFPPREKPWDSVRKISEQGSLFSQRQNP